MGLLFAFLAGFFCALAYQRYLGRDWGRTLHLSIVAGLVCLLVLFVGALVADTLGLLPAYNVAS